MKLIMVMVETINGKTTFNDTPGTAHFSSIEDQSYFLKVRNENNLSIMGRKTYEEAKEGMNTNANRLRVILTSQPEKFKSEEVRDRLEFSSESPQDLVRTLEERGFTQGLLLGGERTNTDFLKAGLVTEIWLTVEPHLFGRGNDLLSETDLDLKLKLISSRQLNDQGTLLLKYAVLT